MAGILRSTSATIEARFYDHESEILADPGTVTVDVFRADGTQLVDDGPTGGTGAAPRTFGLTGTETGQVDRLRAVWTSTTLGERTTLHEVVGGVYLELADIRALQDLSDAVDYPTSNLVAARDWFEELTEDWCGVAFVPRFALDTVTATFGEPLLLNNLRPRRILSATDTDTGTAVDFSDWELQKTGEIVGAPTGVRLQIGYEHGYDRPDADLLEAAKIGIRSKLLTDRAGRASRETLLINELGAVRLAQPDGKHATGIPEVDRPLNDHREFAFLR